MIKLPSRLWFHRCCTTFREKKRDVGARAPKSAYNAKFSGRRLPSHWQIHRCCTTFQAKTRDVGARAPRTVKAGADLEHGKGSSQEKVLVFCSKTECANRAKALLGSAGRARSPYSWPPTSRRRRRPARRARGGPVDMCKWRLQMEWVLLMCAKCRCYRGCG